MSDIVQNQQGVSDEDQEKPQKSRASLTLRQKQVLVNTAAGFSARAIALKIGISVRMVRWHLRQAREQLGAVSTAQAVHLAGEQRLLDE